MRANIASVTGKEILPGEEKNLIAALDKRLRIPGRDRVGSGLCRSAIQCLRSDIANGAGYGVLLKKGTRLQVRIGRNNGTDDQAIR